jgi:hypothetical protein
LGAVQCLCQEYRFALQDACRIALAETMPARLARLLIELAHHNRRTHRKRRVPFSFATDA